MSNRTSEVDSLKSDTAILIRMPSAEKSIIKKAAKRAGISLSKWSRSALLTAAGVKRKVEYVPSGK